MTDIYAEKLVQTLSFNDPKAVDALKVSQPQMRQALASAVFAIALNATTGGAPAPALDGAAKNLLAALHESFAGPFSKRAVQDAIESQMQYALGNPGRLEKKEVHALPVWKEAVKVLDSLEKDYQKEAPAPKEKVSAKLKELEDQFRAGTHIPRAAQVEGASKPGLLDRLLHR